MARGTPWAFELLIGTACRRSLCWLAFVGSPAANRTPYLILDCNRRIIGALVGRPREEDGRVEEERWDASMQRLAGLFKACRETYSDTFTKKQVKHRRGNFAAVSFGVSYGGGQTRPGNLAVTKAQAPMVLALRSSPDMKRVAGFGSEALAAYFPKPYDHMREAVDGLYARQPELERNFENSEYPTATANLGPDTVCDPHNDCTNFPGLACCITALGGFNPDLGGYFCMWDLGLKIRFPPASTILVSSAGVRHSNTPIQKGEERYSFTQYCPGGNLRWARHGYRPAYKLTPTERLRLDGGAGEGWAEQLARLSTWDSLAKDRAYLVEQEVRRAGLTSAGQAPAEAHAA
ncbi:hypothetical protein BV25DRAFT_1807721 [Artomyces pyxidatus]|uniref:Uncharacterized protein n=1 Tax=Artomyces pyxidatus TaxID=48021 RepID=A0ACB8SVY4_9AGAM|nr:hypothetical protein BV25DRAFT_1807721 [Artomyces pyxidatus]